MSSGSGGKPPSGSQPGRPAAETPQRLVVRSADSNADSMLGATDTAVAVAEDKRTSMTIQAEAGDTRRTGFPEIVGETLSGRYLVTRKIGQGGMGAVYEATHTLINKRVAVKVLLEKYAQREAIVKRLKQEAQLASQLRNEHIIDITDFGTTDDGRTFVVMEYLEGESLAECLARDTQLPEQRILRIIGQAASALAAAHEEGIVHRDIKPENLFLLKRKEEDFVKVVDFGISKSLRASGEEEEQPRLTQTGMVLGTPLYMSPQQARGDDELDARVDIYALGVIMYEASTGRVPFVGNNYLSVISQVLNEDPKPPRELRAELSEEFEAIVLRAMSKDRKERYASATELLGDLTALLEDPTRSTERAKITGPRKKLPKRNPLRLVAWIAVVSVIIAAVIFAVNSMMGGGGSQKAVKDAGVANVPPPVDAVVAPVVSIDAPTVEMVGIQIISDPPGAQITRDGITLDGVTPMKVDCVKDNKTSKFVAHVDGFDDLEFTVNTLEYASKPVHIKLKKPPKGTTPIQHVTPKPPDGKGSGSATPQGSKSGEFGGLPATLPGTGSGSGKK